MGETLQYRRVTKLGYSLGNGQIKINMDGSNDDYFSNVDEIQIDPGNVDLNNFEIGEDAVKIDFLKPVVCNIRSGRYYKSMTCGAKLEGKNRVLYVEKLEDLASKLEILRDEAVEKKKEEIELNKNEIDL